VLEHVPAADGCGRRPAIVAGMSRPIATTDRVDRDELLRFVAPRHHHVLVTRRRDGAPQLSPVTGGLDDGAVVIATYPQRAKVHNLRRDPTATVLVLSDEWNGPWVQLDGHAEVIDLPDAVEPLVGYFRAVAGEHDDWDEYRQAMRDQGKCLIRVRIDGWGPIATGGFPPHLAQG
jgi:PPOX class probable F420-dependent enzyme